MSQLDGLPSPPFRGESFFLIVDFMLIPHPAIPPHDDWAYSFEIFDYEPFTPQFEDDARCYMGRSNLPLSSNADDDEDDDDDDDISGDPI